MLPNIFKVAKEISYSSNHDEFKLGAAIYRNGKLLSKGCNSSKSHPKMIRYNTFVTTHAEFSAINKVKNKELLKGATLVIYRENKNGQIALSRCCEMCIKMVKQLGFKKIVFTTSNGYEIERI